MAGKIPPRIPVPPVREKAPHVVRALVTRPSAAPSVQAKPAGKPAIARPVAAHVQAMLGRRAPAVQAQPRPARPGGSRAVQAAQGIEMTTYVRENGKLYVTLNNATRVFVSERAGPHGRTRLAVYALNGFYRKDMLGYLDYEVLGHGSDAMMSIVKVQSYAPGMGTILALELARRSHSRNIGTMVAGMPADTDDAKKYYGDLGFDYEAAQERERKRRQEIYKDQDLSTAKIVVPEVQARTTDVIQNTYAKLSQYWKAPEDFEARVAAG